MQLYILRGIAITLVTTSILLGAEAPLEFNRDIRPILSDKCFFCHGPDKHERKADLRLDTRDGALKDLGGYAAIVPGNPKQSEFVVRMNHTDPDDRMPPEKSHKKLKPREIALLTRWIAEGAPYAKAWTYEAPRKHPVPKTAKSKKWIDAFVFKRLAEEGLTPSPQADRVTLIRRLYFDLTGLPPKPAAVDAFVAAKNLDQAWTKLVDELLASPRFGERMAIYWLDLVRYADTVGYHGDQDHNISPYRDYVVNAFNNNLPFDQFTREQLAGDLLPDPTIEQKVATGYNRLLQTSHEGGIQAKEYNAIYAADRVRNVSAVWMGATVGCAQCHDHKYDPYTTRDFYSMAAFFADIHDAGYSGNSLPTKRPPEIRVYTPEQQKQLDAIDEKIAEAKEDPAQQKTLKAERKKLEGQGRLTMITVAKPPRTMRILPRGNWQDDSGEVVTAAVPEFMGKIETPEGQRATRLDLANWLTDPVNGSGGLTARVFANRFWYLFFGTGISKSLEDFGGQGEPPANPELLDNLAIAFLEADWDVKAMVRLLVTSQAYRQSSITPADLHERDPYNQLVARQSRYRLPAEMIRDNALAISGLLVLGEGGPSVKPYQPVGYYRHLNFPVRKYVADKDQGLWRRGLYVHWQRMFLHPMLKAMDAPSREECTAQRPRSNTPTSALVLLNDPSFVEAAKMFACHILEHGGSSTEARLDWAFRQALSRKPDGVERKLMQDLIEQNLLEYEADPAAAKALLDIGETEVTGDFPVAELASWTAFARAILNVNEVVTRN